jgi:hypothetical protein
MIGSKTINALENIDPLIGGIRINAGIANK